MIKMKWLVLSLTLFNMLGCQSMAQPNVTVGSTGLSKPLNVVAQVRKNKKKKKENEEVEIEFNYPT